MHVPDHVLDSPTVAAAGIAAAAVVAVAVWRGRAERTRGRVSLAAGASSAVFAAQLVNYPIASGTSGHFIGAALLTALLGPWLALSSMTVVLAVQALVFADGGVSALGVNVVLMAVVPVAVTWAIMKAVRAARRRPSGAVLATGLGAVASVPASVFVFSGLYAVGGATTAGFGAVLGSMMIPHVLVGGVEAGVSMAVVAAVASVSPGLAYADGRELHARLPESRGVLVAWLIGVSGLCMVALAASDAPDAFEVAAARLAFPDVGHLVAWSPLSDYGANAGLSVSLVGGVGVALCAVTSWSFLRASGTRIPSKVR